jgi:hypothetical protein
MNEWISSKPSADDKGRKPKESTIIGKELEKE